MDNGATRFDGSTGRFDNRLKRFNEFAFTAHVALIPVAAFPQEDSGLIPWTASLLEFPSDCIRP
jgi:hypothetical protein